MKPQIPLTSIPKSAEVLIVLIKQELKSRKLFSMLHEIGVNDCAYEPHLDFLILRSLGMDDEKDETFNMYDRIMDKRTRKLKETKESLTKQAFKAYIQLISAKEKRKSIHETPA